MVVVEATHTVQLAIISAMLVADVAGLIFLNRLKAKGHRCRWSWPQKRAAYWILIASAITVEVLLDVQFPAITSTALAVKAYAFAFPLGLLDLFFSETKGVPLMCCAGAALWCSTIVVRNAIVNGLIGGEGLSPVLVDSVSPSTLAREIIRYVVSLPLIGVLSDLIFSPMHRLLHHPRLYTLQHKQHHEYTNNLTSLVLYHGALLDDFLMPLTTAFGGALYVGLCGLVGLHGSAFSSVSGYLIIFNTLLSHAHDTRCARLMAPLPDSLNFVAYHYVHHLSPSHNFGLTEPSDKLWDALLGVSTIKKLADFEAAGGATTTGSSSSGGSSGGGSSSSSKGS